MARTKGLSKNTKKKTEDFEKETRRLAEIIKILKREYPEAQCSLYFNSPYQLLVATILSAQCTDERVNKVVPHLFAKYPGPKEMAHAPLKAIEKLIQSTGFFRNKALSIQGASRAIMENHGGEVPKTLEELTALRGVGRKTANVVLGNAFDIPGMVVDTHVGRLTRRMGFTREKDPEKVEQILMKLVDRQDWTRFSHLLIHHGRAICSAKKALCDDCPVRMYCQRNGI